MREAVQSAIYQIGPDKKQGAHILLLGVIMANNGDNLWQGVIHDFAQKEGITIERWVEKTINTGLIELQRYK